MKQKSIAKKPKKLHNDSQVEETLGCMLYLQQRQEASQNIQHYDENDVAALVDKWQRKGRLPEQTDLGLAAEACKVLVAEQLMQNTRDNHYPLPESLNSLLREAYAHSSKTSQKQKEAALPAIVVELVQDGLVILKSTFQNFGHVMQPVVVTRGTPQKVIKLRQEEQFGKKTNHALLYQKGSGDYLQYELLRNTASSATLIIHIPQDYRKSRISIRQGKHIIASQSCHSKSGHIRFKHLTAGEYKLDFSGAMEHSMKMIIRACPTS